MLRRFLLVDPQCCPDGVETLPPDASKRASNRNEAFPNSVASPHVDSRQSRTVGHLPNSVEPPTVLRSSRDRWEDVVEPLARPRRPARDVRLLRRRSCGRRARAASKGRGLPSPSRGRGGPWGLRPKDHAWVVYDRRMLATIREGRSDVSHVADRGLNANRGGGQARWWWRRPEDLHYHRVGAAAKRAPSRADREAVFANVADRKVAAGNESMACTVQEAYHAF